jgi:hypothetical protein
MRRLPFFALKNKTELDDRVSIVHIPKTSSLSALLFGLGTMPETGQKRQETENVLPDAKLQGD